LEYVSLVRPIRTLILGLPSKWEQAKIIRFGWTGDERLVILNEEGAYRLYDLQGDYVQFSLGTDAGEVGITDARIHDNGLVAMTGSLQLLEVKGWEGGKPLTLANPGESSTSFAGSQSTR
jgi:hypothetical protein